MAARENSSGMKFIAIHYLIFADIDYPDVKMAYETLCNIASQMSLSQEQIEALLKEVAESYAKDRGWSLIRAAFPSS
jgi:hypothetical protein